MDNKLLINQSNNKRLFNILNNKYTYLAVFFIFIQQLIVGISIMALIEIGKNLTLGRINWTPWGIFTLSLILVYIPGIIYLVFGQKAKNYSLDKLIKKILMPYQDRASLFGNPAVEKGLKPWLTSESYQVIDDTFSYFFSITATILNVMISILAIGVGIGKQYIFAYLIGVVLVTVFSKLTNKKIHNLSKSMQGEKDNLVHHLSETFPNIILGNQINKNTWKNKYAYLWKNFDSSSVKMYFKVNILSSFSMIFLLLPVIAIVIFDIKFNFQIATIGMLGATLPRQVQLIQSIYNLIYDLNMISSVIGRLETLSTLSVDVEDSKKLIKFDKIQLMDTKINEPIMFNDFNGAYNYLAKDKDRYTIRGGNGVGKSILLRSIKEKLGDEAFYLPVENSSLQFDDISKKLSSGQRIKEILMKVKNSKKLKYLLLDEWDANLDFENKKILSNMLDELKNEISIIEVRH